MQLKFEPRYHWAHPIQRVIHNYMETLARRKAGPHYLEIGAHPRSINNNPAVTHRCFIRPTGRDVQRWNSAPRRGLANAIRRGVLANRSSSEYCVDGFCGCDYKSDVGLALYSLQDVSPRDVACAMYRHGMHTLYVCLHLPPECLLPDGEYNQTMYHVVQQAGNTVVTYVGDSSAGYRHLTKTLRQWVTTTQVTGRHPIIIERVRSIGCHFLMCITASPCAPMPYRPYPNSDFVYVLDVFGPGVGAGVVSDGVHAYYPVPLDIWRRLMMFGETLDDDAFCCSRLQTYLRGISHKVTIGNIVANAGWQPDERSLTALITASYLTIAHQRWLRTQGISRGVARLKTEHAQGFFRRVAEWLLPCMRSVGVGFYKQLKHWLSAGLVINPQAFLFDSSVRCACPLLHRAVGTECWVPSPWGNLRYVDTGPKPISASVVKSRPNTQRPVVGKPGHVKVASYAYPGVRLREPQQQDLETRLWARGDKYYVVCYQDLELIPAFPPSHAVYKRRPDLIHRCRFVRRGVDYGPIDTLFGYDSTVRKYFVQTRFGREYFDSFTGLNDRRGYLTFPCGDLIQLPDTVLSPTPTPAQVIIHRDPSPPAVAVDSGPSGPAVPAPVSAGPEVLLTLPDGARILAGDLFSSKCHWLVNAANADFLPGGGICGQFHRRYPELFPVNGRRFGRVLYQCEPRPVIHAVAPDYRVKQDPRALDAVYADSTDRTETAAYPVLGAGIYCVPYMESVAAWLHHHLPGDELYVHPADRHKYLGCEVIPPKTLTVTKDMADRANVALAAELEPFKGFIGGLVVSAGSVNYDYITGVPGSGKSNSIVNDGQLVVVPTKELKTSWKARGFTVATPHRACQRAAGRDLVIDEAPSLPPHLLLLLMQQARSAVLLGDPKQIPALDFQHTGLVESLRLPLVPSQHWTHTHRCPQDVCLYLAADYPGITTSNPVHRSLFWGQPSAGQIIVFTQAAKAAYPSAITVHEAQGSTFDQTTLIATLDARGLIASSRAHAIVAVTRHRNRCCVIDEGGLLAEVGLTDAMITMLLGQKLAGTPSPIVAPVREPQHAAAAALPPTSTDVAAALTADASGHTPLEVAAVIPPCPPLEQGVLFFPDRLDGKDDVLVVRLSDTVHCRLLAPADRLSVVSTLVGRYGKMTATPRESFDLRAGCRDFICDLTDCRPTEIEYLELVDAMTAKGQTGELVLELTNDNKDCYRITFFQKDCNKFTLDENVQHGKVGQGISAWPKTLCALFGPWFRAMEKRIVAGLPSGWFYGDLYTEADLHAHVIAVPTHSQVFENDFSEFDSTQNNVSLSFECGLLREAGMPEWMVRLYWLQRSYWTLVAPTAALRGCWKKHSGEPGTLLFNTVWNMVVVNACYKFIDGVVYVFKGDDSVVVCRDYELKEGGQHLVTSCGLKLKQKFGKIGCFSNYIVAPGAGVCKDLFRTWGRMTEKNFSSESRSHDLCVAAADFVSGVVSQGKEFLTIEINAAYYSQPRGFFEVVWGAIQSVANGRMDLTSFKLPILRG
ncbi:non-structural polyprotein [Longquan Rhinolophus sinicus orthohepevirus 1]|nr:non-structural polyprotein [Longquan Rhinolophus sinicus orthohepevirus 1]